MNPIVSAIDRKLSLLPVGVSLRLPGGMQIGVPGAEVKFHIKDNVCLAHLAAGDIGLLAIDYVQGRCELEGPLRGLMQAAAALLPANPVESNKFSWLRAPLDRFISAARHSLARDARQIAFHYDLSDEFYALWLDPRRVYSCAYFRDPGMSLAEAQEAKLEHICRKLKLRPGERYLDVGSGWGGLLLWAAENYGVHATGITLSQHQFQYVSELIERKGLTGRVSVQLLDYRNLNPVSPFDKISSVGMFEHVGRANLSQYFSQLTRLLRPGGLILNHGITASGINNPMLGNGLGDFIEQFIFPGGELTHIGHVLHHMTEGGLESVDMECLRPHYARTLWAWSDALERQLSEAARILQGEPGAKALRAYRLYLAGCALAFEQGWVSLYQVLGQHAPTGRRDELDRPSDLSYPWSRDYMY